MDWETYLCWQVSAVPEITGGDLQAFNVKTLPYPGLPTDLQAQCMALLTTCLGSSIVEESVFENRMHHGMCWRDDHTSLFSVWLSFSLSISSLRLGFVQILHLNLLNEIIIM